MTIHHWFYRLVRKRSKPIPENVAVLWKRRLSIAYGLIAWNTLGIVLYMVFTGKSDWADYHGLKTEEEKAMPAGRAWANTLGINNAKVYRISGLQMLDEYEIVDGQEVRVTTKNEEKIEQE